MHGTWKVTGVGLLGSLLTLGFAAMGAAAGWTVAVWLLARIWWILGSSAGVTVAAMLILARLMRWARARDERDAVAWTQRRVQLRAEAPPPIPAPLPAPQRQAIEHHHYGPQIHVYGQDGEETAARIIRSALPPPDLPGTVGKP